MVVISNNVHNQPQWWKKGQSSQGKNNSTPCQGGEHHDAQFAMEAEHYMDNFKAIKDGHNQVACEPGEG